MKWYLFNRTLIWIIALMILLGFSVLAEAQQSEGSMMGQSMQGMMSGPMMGQGMMGRGMMGSGMMPTMGMGKQRIGDLEGMGLMAKLQCWGSYFFTQKDQIGITEAQLDKVESILSSHVKYAIRKEAELKVLLIEIQELLVKDKTDLQEVEKKLKAMETLDTEINMEGIRTLEQALAVLNPEQQKKMKALFKESSFIRAMGAGQGTMMMGGMNCPEMMKQMTGMMGQGGMMGGKMESAPAPEAKTASSSLTQTDSQGPVTVTVTYLNPQQKVKEGELAFEVKLETHSVELGQYKLEELSALKNDKGETAKALSWQTPTKEGHHVSGTLTFEKSIVRPETKYIELTIKDIGSIKERVFRWTLSQ